MGKPHSNPDAIKKALLASLIAGNYRKIAAADAGINESTFRLWRLQDPKFEADVIDAEMKAEAYHVKNIKKHSIKNWVCSAWWLQRRASGRWSDTTKLQLNQGPREEWDKLTSSEKLIRINELETKCEEEKRKLLSAPPPEEISEVTEVDE